MTEATTTNSIDENSINESTVAQYLTDNPDFFASRDELLMSMVIPHESGEAISLLERQVNLLRDKNNERQQNINDFIANAKANDELFEKIRTIILELLKTSSLKQLSSVVQLSLKDDFAASISKLVFVSDSGDEEEGDHTILSPAATKEALGELFNQKRSYCGSLVSHQAKLLFPEIDTPIVSAAIIPIHISKSAEAANIPGIPLLLIGSNKENHFHSNLDTLFLDFIGEVLAVHITEINI